MPLCCCSLLCIFSLPCLLLGCAQVQHLVRQLTEQVVDLPLLQGELLRMRTEVMTAEERVRTASEAVEALQNEQGREAKWGRMYERSLAEQSCLTDRVAELMSRPRGPSDEVVRRHDAAVARQ